MLLQCYKHDDVLAVVTVSEDNRNFLVDGCTLNASNVFTLLNGIDANLFHPPSVKARRIVFLERKFSHHAKAVHTLSVLRPTFANYSFRSLGRLTHPEIAREFQEALVFLYTGHPEGFGLPLAEAIACGCIVVGYDGLGSRDFCYPALRYVPFGDILSFVNTLERAIVDFENPPSSLLSLLLKYADSILRNYSLEMEKSVSSQTWSSIHSKFKLSLQ